MHNNLHNSYSEQLYQSAHDSKELPVPAPFAQQHSEDLIMLIKNEIDKNDGAISFTRYMELALYAPALGYYAAGSVKLGEEGDFVTAPEISPLFVHRPSSRSFEASILSGDLSYRHSA